MFKLKIRVSYLYLFAVFFLGACSSTYQIQRSNRVQYNINGQVAADSSIIDMYLPYKVQLDAEMNKVIGHSAVAMAKNTSMPETLLSNFFSDAVFQQALKEDAKIDFAIPSTKDGIRADLPKGELDLNSIFQLMPFENELLVVELTGADVQDLLNYIAYTNGQPVAGIKMKIVNRKPVAVEINGKPFNSDRSYRVLTSDYIAQGGDNLTSFKNGKVKILGLKVRDAIINYVMEAEAQGLVINPILDGRITKG